MAIHQDQTIILFYGYDPTPLREAMPDASVSVLDNREELAHGLINTTGIALLVVEIDNAPEDIETLLHSVRSSFPLMPIAAIGEPGTTVTFPGTIDLTLPPGEFHADMVTSLKQLANEGVQNNRRKHHRFDWPLEAILYHDGIPEGSRRVRALSAGGAYLEDNNEQPRPASSYEIAIQFQNFTFSTECSLLDRRVGSSMFPPGFGIRFENLSPQGQELIDRVVSDALMEILLDPTTRPEVPSLDEDDLVFSTTDEFTLTE